MLLVFLVLSIPLACGGGGGSADVETGPADPPASSPLVVLVRYGGIAGTSERISVDALGVATLVSDRSSTPSTRTLLPGDLASLRNALVRSEIATLRRNYLDPRAADAFQYDVTYQGVTVTADEGVLPSSLRPVVDQLTRLMR